MANGIWGVIAVGLFATPQRLEEAYGNSAHVGWFYSFGSGDHDATLLATQVIGVLFILGWVTGIMLPFFVWLDWKGWFRSDPLEEIVGLDLSYHGGSALKGNGGEPAVYGSNVDDGRLPTDTHRSETDARSEYATDISLPDSASPMVS